MRFITYFELNPDLDPTEIASIGIELMEKKLYPAKGVETLSWYISTGYWGIAVSEADSGDALMNNVNAWRIAKPGIFLTFKTAPAMETRELIPKVVNLARKIKK